MALCSLCRLPKSDLPGWETSRAFLFQADDGGTDDGGTDRMTGYSNATPSGSYASSQRSAMYIFSNTFGWSVASVLARVHVNPDCFHRMIPMGLAFFRETTGEGTRAWSRARS